MYMSNSQTIRVGIVGSGYVSSYHIRALQSLSFVEVVGIADPDTQRARAVAASFGIASVFTSLDQLMLAKPDVVHILTPPRFHCELAVKAMQAGAHVLVEKPMAETSEECELMISVAERTGRVLSVNHSARMDPIVLKAHGLIASGAIGDVLSVHFFRNSDYPPYQGGPVPEPYQRGSYPFRDLGVHGLYLVESFLGRINAVETHPRATGREPNLFFDEWHSRVECERGDGHMYISWNSRPMQNELVIHGTRGVMNVDCYLQTLSMQTVLPAPKPLQRMVGTALSSLRALIDVPVNAVKFVTGKLKPNPGIHVSVRSFYESLTTGAPPPVTADEGRRMVGWMERCSLDADAAKIAALQPSPAASAPRILVTGASGLLGSALLKRLRQRGETVRVLMRRPSPDLAADPKLDVIYGDLGDPSVVDAATEGIDLVYHVGAAMKGGKAAFDSGTVWGTKNVIASCLKHRVRRLVYVSSITVLDHAGHQPDSVIDESYALEPHADRRGFYTQAKLEAENLVKAAIRDQQLPAVILRPGQIFGKGSEKFAPAGTIGLGSRWIVVGSGSRALPLVYIDDVIDALLVAAEREGVCGSIFHIVDPVLITQKEYIERCLKAVPTLKVMYVPKPVLYAAALLADVVSRLTKVNLPLSRYRLASSRPLTPFNCAASTQGLGWKPATGSKAGLTFAFGAHPRAEAGMDALLEKPGSQSEERTKAAVS